MKTLITLQRSSYTLAFAVLAVASLGAQVDKASGKVQANRIGSPSIKAPNQIEAPAVGSGGKLVLKPTPTFEGDLVRVDPTPTFDGDLVTTGPTATFEGDLVQTGLTPVDSGPAVQFKIAKLDAPAVTWNMAPTQITLQPGEHVLLEVSLAQPHLVRWTGAREIEIGNFHSRAEFVAEGPGLQLVQAEFTSLAGKSLGVANLVIEVAGAIDPSPRAGGIGPVLGLPSATCRMSAQIVPGITHTFIAVVTAWNLGQSATAFQFELGATAPAGKAWAATTPGASEVIEPFQSTKVFIAFTLLDTDPESDPVDGSATLSLMAFGKHGIFGLLGSSQSPACATELLDVYYGFNGN